jgi:hypothetical protein
LMRPRENSRALDTLDVIAFQNGLGNTSIWFNRGKAAFE